MAVVSKRRNIIYIVVSPSCTLVYAPFAVFIMWSRVDNCTWATNNELRNNPNVIYQVKRLIYSIKLFMHLHSLFEKGGNIIWTLADSVFVGLHLLVVVVLPLVRFSSTLTLFMATGSVSRLLWLHTDIIYMNWGKEERSRLKMSHLLSLSFSETSLTTLLNCKCLLKITEIIINRRFSTNHLYSWVLNNIRFFYFIFVSKCSFLIWKC